MKRALFHNEEQIFSFKGVNLNIKNRSTIEENERMGKNSLERFQKNNSKTQSYELHQPLY